MAAPLPEPTTVARILSPEEGRQFFDEQCLAMLGITGAEFIRRWDAGFYKDVEDIPKNNDILHISLLLPLGRQ